MMSHELHLTLFAGINTPFILSIIAVVSGLGIFATRNTWRVWALPTLPQGTQIYTGIVSGVEKIADQLLKTQNGKLRYYLIVILASVALLQASAGLGHVNLNLHFEITSGTDILRALLLLLSLGATLASIFYRKHLLAALALGLSGYSVGGLFLLEPAPDVALVQFMVETVGTVLLIVMLGRIDADERERAMESLWKQSQAGLARDIIIATVIGLGVGLFALAAVNNRPAPQTIASWHIDHASDIGINDVVGAIVTDFRGMDTIIEITVFSVAALGVITILAAPLHGAGWPVGRLKVLRRFNRTVLPPDEAIEMPEALREESKPLISGFSTPLTRIVTLFILPFSFLVALTQLLYGGDAPGDGFTAGVITGLGVTLCYIVFGYHESHRRLRWLHPRRLIGSGLMLVIINAMLPLLFGASFLKHTSLDQILLPANLHLSSTLVYETGIFLTVLGSISMVMEAIAYPKEVEPL